MKKLSKFGHILRRLRPPNRRSISLELKLEIYSIVTFHSCVSFLCFNLFQLALSLYLLLHCCTCVCVIASFTPPISFTLQVWYEGLLNLTFSVRVLGVISFALRFHSHYYVMCGSPPFFFALTVFVVSFTPFCIQWFW